MTRPAYCLVADGGRHLASLRLRPAAAGSMLARHFPALRAAAGGGLTAAVEVTRFCSSPGLSPDDRLAAVSDLLLGLCRHCQCSGIERFFGVVFPSVARMLARAGWPGQVLAEGGDASGTLVLAEWTASDLVAWELQDRRATREELRGRRQPMPEPERRLVA